MGKLYLLIPLEQFSEVSMETFVVTLANAGKSGKGLYRIVLVRARVVRMS